MWEVTKNADARQKTPLEGLGRQWVGGERSPWLEASTPGLLAPGNWSVEIIPGTIVPLLSPHTPYKPFLRAVCEVSAHRDSRLSDPDPRSHHRMLRAEDGRV